MVEKRRAKSYCLYGKTFNNFHIYEEGAAMPSMSEIFGEKLMKKLESYPKILLEWLSTTKGDCRIENCLFYIQERGVSLPFEKGDIEGLKDLEALEQWNINFIAGFLFAAGAPLLFSPQLVDALVRPRHMYEVTAPSYEFFLANAHEHKIIRDRLRQMVLYGNTILVVRPVLYAERGIVAWAYDSWTGAVYTFKPYALSEKEISEARSQRKLISIGSQSTLESYAGCDHPFLKMMKRTHALIRTVLDINDAHDYHQELPVAYYRL